MGRNQKDYFDYGDVYHIYNKVVTGQKLFESECDYQYFLEKYMIYLSPYFDTFAYCLIPNHFHFLVKVKEKEMIDVSKEDTNAAKKYLDGEESVNFFLENQLSRMFSGIALRHNRAIGREGALFKEGTKRVLLKTENRMVYQLCYIHHNPIHHHLTKRYDAWRYSSYNAYLSRKPSRLQREDMLEILDGIDGFLEIHREFKLDMNEDLFGEFDGWKLGS